MEQKDYKMEIVDMLGKKESHVRELAKLIHLNHMTTLRKIRELKEMNIIDYRKEGKNNVYFIKPSLEARNFVLMVEYYKLLKILEKHPHLRGIVDNIMKNDEIKLAILFGSYAKGLAKKDSDIDIFIEGDDRNIRRRLELSNSKLSIKLGEFDVNNPLIKEIKKNHVILKGVEKYYEKQRFFETA